MSIWAKSWVSRLSASRESLGQKLKFFTIENLFFLYGVSLLTSMALIEITSSVILTIGLFYISPMICKNEFRNIRWSGVAQVLFCFLSLWVNSYSGELIFHSLAWYRWILILFCLIYFFSSSPKIVHRFIYGLMLGLFLSSINSFVQLITGWDFVRGKLIKYTAVSNEISVRVYGFFSLPTTYGYVLSMCLFVPLFVIVFGKRASVLRKVALINFALGCFSLLFSFSRGAWLALIFGLSVFMWSYARKWLLPLVIAILIAGVGLYKTHDGFNERIGSLFSSDYYSNAQRVEIWSASLKIFQENPWLGVGFRRLDVHLEQMHRKLKNKHSFVSHAHNIFLQSFATMGLFGGFALTFFLFSLFQLLKERSGTENCPMCAQMGFYALLIFVFGGFFDCNLLDAEVRSSFLALVSLGLSPFANNTNSPWYG